MSDHIVKNILPAMVKAPSAHNTQPWRFVVTDRTIDVYVEWSRHLTVSDPSHRELYVSLGCAIENGLIAAKHFGYTTSVSYFPEGEGVDLPAARIMCQGDSSPEPPQESKLVQAIDARRTDRSLYDQKPLTEGEQQAMRIADTPGILTVSDRQAVERVAEISEQGTYATLSRADFKEELSHWVRNDWTRQPDGMPGYAMGMPAPLSLVASTMIKIAPIHKQEGPKTRQQIASASQIIVIATPTDGPVEWMKAGQILERVWLQATMTGLAVAPIVAAIEAGQATRKQLQDVLQTELLPQSLIRIGHGKPTALRATPRRTVEDCVSRGS